MRQDAELAKTKGSDTGVLKQPSSRTTIHKVFITHVHVCTRHLHHLTRTSAKHVLRVCANCKCDSPSKKNQTVAFSIGCNTFVEGKQTVVCNSGQYEVKRQTGFWSAHIKQGAFGRVSFFGRLPKKVFFFWFPFFKTRKKKENTGGTSKEATSMKIHRRGFLR